MEDTGTAIVGRLYTLVSLLITYNTTTTQNKQTENNNNNNNNKHHDRHASDLSVGAFKLQAARAREVDAEVFIAEVQTVVAVITHQAVRHVLHAIPAREHCRQGRMAR